MTLFYIDKRSYQASHEVKLFSQYNILLCNVSRVLPHCIVTVTHHANLGRLSIVKGAWISRLSIVNGAWIGRPFIVKGAGISTSSIMKGS